MATVDPAGRLGVPGPDTVPEYLKQGTDQQGEGQGADSVRPSERSTAHQDGDLEAGAGGPNTKTSVDKRRHKPVTHTGSPSGPQLEHRAEGHEDGRCDHQQRPDRCRGRWLDHGH